MRSLTLLYRLGEDMRRRALMNAMREDPFAMFQRMSTPFFSMPSQLFRFEPDMELPSQPKVGKDGYQVSLDVAQYQPNELTVKAVDKNTVVIEGKYEEHDEGGRGGFISKHFVRRFVLPDGYKADAAIPTLSSDGVLTVSVPKPPELKNETNERVLPIQHTGPAHLNVKENPAETPAAEELESPNAAKKVAKAQ